MMLGLDTNVLVRFVTGDDPGQADLARELILGAEREAAQLHVSTLVVTELAWVLGSRSYGYTRQEIVEVLELILDSRVFAVQDRDLVRRALAGCRSGEGDFADLLIGEQDARAGCAETLTFDRRLARRPGLRLLAEGYALPGGSDRVSESRTLRPRGR